jgi:hypothetical protein
MSYTSQNTVCVWYGALGGGGVAKNVTGGSYPALFARHIYANLPAPHPFDVPRGVVELETDVCASDIGNLYLASPHTPARYRQKELFDITHAPSSYSDYFESAIPADFNITTLPDGSVQIQYTPKKGFVYRLYKKNNGAESLLNGNLDDKPCSGLTAYYLAVYTAEGDFIANTVTKSRYNFNFNLFGGTRRKSLLDGLFG